MIDCASSPDRHRGLVLRGTLVGWAQYAVAVAVTLVVTPFVLGHVGPASYGAWLLLTQVLGYSGLLDLGVTPALVRQVSEARGRSDQQALRVALGTALRFHTVAGAACLGFGLALAGGLARCFEIGDIQMGTARQTILIATVAAAIGFPGTALVGALRGFQRVDLAASLGVTSHLVRAGATFVALELTLGLPGLAAAVLLGSLLVLVGGAILLKRVSGLGLDLIFVGSSSALRRLLSFGAFSLIGTAGWQLAYGSDVVLVSATLTAVDAAHFGLAVNVLTMVSAFVGAFTANLTPLASLYEARGQTERAQETYLLGTRFAAVLSLPQLAILYMEGRSLLVLWLGPSVGTPAGQILELLVLAHVPVLINAAGMPLALGLGLQRAGAALMVSEGLTKVLLALLLVGSWGTKGVVIATLAAGLLHQGLAWPWTMCRNLRISLRRFAWRTLAPVLPIVLAITSGLHLLQRLETTPTLRLTLASALLLAYWYHAIRRVRSVRHGLAAAT